MKEKGRKSIVVFGFQNRHEREFVRDYNLSVPSSKASALILKTVCER